MDNNILFIIAFSIVIVCVIIIPISISIIKNKNVRKGNKIQGNGNTQQNGDGNASFSGETINYYNSEVKQYLNSTNEEISIERIKNELKVVFVDDKRFNVVDLLKKSGWKQISYKKDISNLDDPYVKEAHVFFLDINGVGVAMNFNNQGMGLCGALKKKYGDKKRVVLYSGETDGNIFDADAKMADDTLKKDSDLYQFTSLMEQYGKELL
jgi:hypothetical protein